MKKLLVCGKGKAAYFALKYASEILSGEFEIFYVYRESEVDIIPDIEKNNVQFASELGIKSVAVRNSRELLDTVLELKPSFIVLAQFSIIISKELLEYYHDRVINLHYGKLPEYRGVAPITHALLNKESECSVTLHYVDSGIDTGDIINEKSFSVKLLTNEEAYRVCEIEGGNLLKWLYKVFLNSEEIKRYKQISENQRYYDKSSINYSNTSIDLSLNSEDLIAFYYAFTFPSKNLYPYLLIKDKKYIIISVPVVLVSEPNYEDYNIGEIIDFNLTTATFRCQDAVVYVNVKEY